MNKIKDILNFTDVLVIFHKHVLQKVVESNAAFDHSYVLHLPSNFATASMPMSIEIHAF